MRQEVLVLATAAAVLLTAGGAYAGSTHHNNYIDVDNSNTVTNNNNSTNNTDNTNNNTNTNTNNNNSNADASSSADAQSTSSATATATGGSATSEGGDSNSSTSVSIDGDDNPASSAAPVYLTSSNDTCMGSTGIGGQGMTFGFSIGTTWTDNNCIMLKNSREMKNQGHDKAAKARLCMDEDNAVAFELAGTPCPRKLKSAQNAIAKIKYWNENDGATAQVEGQTAFLKAGTAASDSEE
jgi:hypothetical protein